MKLDQVFDGSNYVSLKKLFNSCCYMQKKYNAAFHYLENSFYLKNNSIVDYSVEYYDYEKDCLVMLAHFPFLYFEDNYYYFGLKDSCVVPAVEIKSQERKEIYDSIISKYCEEITKSIFLLREFKDFKTKKCEDVEVIGLPYLLDLNSFCIALSSVSDEDKAFRVVKDYYFKSNDFKSNNSRAIEYFITNERKIMNNSYVNILDLPEWCVDSIYDYSNRGLLGKFRKRFNKVTVSSDVIDKIKKTEKLEDAKKRDLALIINEIGGLINKANSLSIGENYERIVLDDYSILFEKKNDHLEIKKTFIPLLKYIDLSLVPFDNVYVSGIDFTDSNVSFNPQKVYKKDLSFCTFGDVDRKENIIPFSVSTNFKGVDLRGTVINDPHSDFHYILSGAIVDESTSINFSDGSHNKEFYIKKDM